MKTYVIQVEETVIHKYLIDAESERVIRDQFENEHPEPFHTESMGEKIIAVKELPSLAKDIPAEE